MPGNINEDTWKRAKDAVKRKPDEDENSYYARVMTVYKNMVKFKKAVVNVCLSAKVTKGLTEKEYDRFSDDEDEGYDEYMREAKEAINRKDKEAFEEMAKDEKKHKETLKRIRKKKSDVDKAKQTIEGESEDEQPENNKH